MAEAPPSHATAPLRRHAGAHTAHDHWHAQPPLGLSGLLEREIDGRAACVGATRAMLMPAGQQLAYQATRPARMQVRDAPPLGTGSWSSHEQSTSCHAGCPDHQ